MPLTAATRPFGWSSRLSGAIDASVTTLAVEDASMLDAIAVGDYIFAVLNDGTNRELVKIVSTSGNNLTVERGEDSTTARGFGAGTAIYVSFDRKTLDEFVDGKIAASSPGGGGGLTQAQVDARVVDGTKAYARAGNTSKVPRSDLQRLSDVTAQGSSDLQDGDRIAVEDASDSVTKRASIGALGDKIADDQVEDWARDSNTDPIPGPKLSNAPQPASGRLVPCGRKRRGSPQAHGYGNRVGRRRWRAVPVRSRRQSGRASPRTAEARGRC